MADVEVGPKLMQERSLKYSLFNMAFAGGSLVGPLLGRWLSCGGFGEIAR